jgi:phosphotransferase system HPr-like phosphotransfer protein
MAVSCPFDIDIGTDRNMIDAKSIMGVMSLGLNRPLRVSCEQDDQAFDQMLDSLKIA